MARPGPSSASGRVAVITGGSGGIGRAVARRLVARGDSVVVVGSTPDRVEAAAAELRLVAAVGVEVEAQTLDVRRPEDLERMADETLERFGRVDLLLAAAGIARRAGSDRLLPYPVAGLPTEEWDAIIDTNLRGVFLADRAVLPAMVRQGEGTIINVSSSPAGYRGQAYAAAYCASKFGVRGLTQSLAEEVRRFGIRVHAVLPDVVDTAMLDGTTLADRFGGPLPPERVADLVVELWDLPQDSRIIEPTLMPAMRPAGAG